MKLVDLSKMVEAGLSLVCCLVIQGSTDGLLLLRVSIRYFMLSPHLRLIKGLIRDLFVSYIGSLMDKNTLCADQMFRTTAEAKGTGFDSVVLQLSTPTPT